MLIGWIEKHRIPNYTKGQGQSATLKNHYDLNFLNKLNELTTV